MAHKGQSIPQEEREGENNMSDVMVFASAGGYVLSLTPEELRLAENITTEEWRDTYQPQGVGFRHYPLRHKSGTGSHAGVGATGLAGTGENPCNKPLGAQA